ncbi:Mov34/MPN/PAD-1 family protein [Gemmatimonas sp.]|uniref:Mov34/MPN/PAD-1 family protein n=1 Tax=Gemmatimonas sp. TaxID=1962908 RepID=UPI00286E0DFC|nr:Mov34/MPN/PAD-1 family protein [Gemmatimonas sp.]
MSTDIEETLRRESERASPNETGGVLVGHADGDGRTVVTAVVGPGPNAVHTRSRFRRDGDYAQSEVDRLHHTSDGRDDYIGEWHSHPDAGGPSYVDRGSMSWISHNPSYGRREPVLLIMERVRKRAWRPRAYRWVEGRLVEVRASALVDERLT